MAKGKKTSCEDKAKVIEAKIKDPNKSTRYIEKETGIGKNTVGRIISDDLVQVGTESKTIANLIDMNNEIIEESNKLLLEMIRNKEGIRASELVSANKNSFEQNRLVNGESTSKIDLDLKNTSTEDLLKLINQ